MDIDKILENITVNSGLINLILSFIITCATLTYSILTWKITNETKRMREAYTEPKVSVFVEEDAANDGFFDLVIKNIGIGPAYNIIFSINTDQPIDNISLKSLNKLSALTSGITFLAPNQCIKSNISYIHGNNNFFNTAFTITASYESASTKNYHDSYMIKYEMFTGITKILNNPTQEISDNIKEIYSYIKDIGNGNKQIRIITQTSEDHEKHISTKILSHRDYLKKQK